MPFLTVAEHLAQVLYFANPQSMGVHSFDLTSRPDNSYILTSGTGDGVFAYDEDEVRYWLANRDDENQAPSEVYEDFCKNCIPLEDLDIAIAVWLQFKLPLCRTGVCSTILSEKDIEIVEATKAQLA